MGGLGPDIDRCGGRLSDGPDGWSRLARVLLPIAVTGLRLGSTRAVRRRVRAVLGRAMVHVVAAAGGLLAGDFDLHPLEFKALLGQASLKLLHAIADRIAGGGRFHHQLQLHLALLDPQAHLQATELGWMQAHSHLGGPTLQLFYSPQDAFHQTRLLPGTDTR